MDKRIQEVVDFVKDKKNRTTVIAAGVVAAIVAGAAMTARGKKRK